MSNQSSCLCGLVQWEILAEPFNAFNCHCKMCRKAHGTAFATYWFMQADEFNWLSDTDSIVHYRYSHLLVRSFCGACGSVVPYPSEQGSHWVIPGGGHDHGRKSDCHVFAAHHAPWFEITGDLPQHDDYPDFTGLQRVEEEPGEDPEDEVVRGSCLCGAVKYQINEDFKMVQNCHCHRCRKGRAAAHATNGFTSMNGVTFTQGEDLLAEFKVPDARYFTQVYCKTCGSKMPRLDPGREIAVIPFGGLDDDPKVRPQRHIYVNDKADWYDITDDISALPEE
ncbi:MAG: GFA family protein [Pseudomonadota bacterium]